MLSPREVVRDLHNIRDDVRSAFGLLSEEQLNWKPAADSWSVAQCLDHLILTNEQMLVPLEKKLLGEGNTFWENWSPLTGFFGGFLLKSMREDQKKFKAPSDSIVPPSELPADIVERLVANLERVAEKITASEKLDRNKTVITSPFMGLMTYRLSDAFDIIAEHCKRHIRQAKRVTLDVNFPN
ncbi:DinB family protein [Leptolyngbya sp. 7M]|uniref:DinB family protein n=1 Tax=Leptolyngbya sp. 7M TaxID=2812896 RepID=UPI001B8C39AC|nr:DinB family protein [Leptolyngbya sp. 7M]QYO67930.1 DinB family protein [Leptolyngbya sp. 7M]